MFAYRHRQLADDIAAHKQAAEHGLAGGNGGGHGIFGPRRVGFERISQHGRTSGHPAGARHAATDANERQWNPADPDPDLLAGVDAVVHLAGASIAGRFTDAHRRAIRDSRIGPTRRLAELVARVPDGPSLLISASAIGYYGYDRGDEGADRGQRSR